MPVDWSRYPADWKSLVESVKSLCVPAGGTGPACQGCGAFHMEDGTNRTCLTTHHPDRDPGNRHARLTVLCAACHLAVESIARARQRRIEAIHATKDQLTLEDALAHPSGSVASDTDEGGCSA